MSIDRYFAKNASGDWARVPHGELATHRTPYWVDVCHGPSKDGRMMYTVDDRYYFVEAQEAAEFYESGYRLRMFADEAEIDHKGLYIDGVLADGASIDGDPPRHEGEKLREVMTAVETAFGEEEP